MAPEIPAQVGAVGVPGTDPDAAHLTRAFHPEVGDLTLGYRSMLDGQKIRALHVPYREDTCGLSRLITVS